MTMSSTNRAGFSVILLLVVSVIVVFSSLSPLPVSATYSFSNEICYAANACNYLQDATENALENILIQMSEYPTYRLFCAEGNKENYYMHAQAGCASTDGCYDCVHDAKDYLLEKCGKRLGAQVSEVDGSCFIRFENYHIDRC